MGNHGVFKRRIEAIIKMQKSQGTGRGQCGCVRRIKFVKIQKSRVGGREVRLRSLGQSGCVH